MDLVSAIAEAKPARPAEPPRFLPPEAPLEMPPQSLWRFDSPHVRLPACRWLLPRRICLFLCTALLTAGAAYEMYLVLAVAGLTVIEGLVLGLFAVLFAWIAFSFTSSVIGFLLSLGAGERALAATPDDLPPDPARRTALLLPTYNEDPRDVFARIAAIRESVDETAYGRDVDCFVLSDTSDPALWIEEEARFLALVKGGMQGIYYRHRSDNVGRKSGNISEWVRRFGAAYRYMIVLDADSLMTGDAILRLVAGMERHPHVGLIQTLPIIINAETAFSRLQQFAGRLYGPVIAAGTSWWHGPEGNYWGHNAIIRVRAFAEAAGLPELRGRRPFGGHILSHDFIEAGLMRRAGWAVVMWPRLPGSYEECPPTFTDYAARDRRWCQGNLQHAAVLPARGLHWVSRLHLLVGIGAYLTAPLWLTFLLLGMVISLQAQFVRPEYFPSGFSLFPQWPAQDPVRAAWVFAATMSLLVVPKILSWLAFVLHAEGRRTVGGALRAFASMLVEILVSGLLAPIAMIFQSAAVADILRGRDTGWNAQRRQGAAAIREAGRHYWLPSLIGIVMATAAYAVSLHLFLWMMPVTIGLILAVPLVHLTSLEWSGRALRRMGLLLTPEERDPPRIAVRARQISADRAECGAASALSRLRQSAELYEAHLAMLPAGHAGARGDVNADLAVARMKVEQAEDFAEAKGFLRPGEVRAALSDRTVLEQLMRMP